MKKSDVLAKNQISRRQLVRGAGAAALAITLGSSVSGKAEAQAAATPQAAPGRGMPQGGRGPIKVLLITKYHPFDRGPFFDFFDSIGDLITWTHVEQPAARVFLDPKVAEPFDVLVFYDMDGRHPYAGPAPTPGATPAPTVFDTPSEAEKKGLEVLLKSGNKGFVFFHHSCASWTHNWPEYAEVIGGVADWRDPIVVRGKQWPYSGFRGDQPQHITVEDKAHPVMEGLGDGYDITDEVYLWPVFEDSVHMLARTNFDAVDSNFPMQYAKGWRSPKGSNAVAWVKSSERSPVVYFQHGHGPSAWSNPAFKTLMSNSIKWVNTPEAKAWAKAHPQKIFKS